MEKRVSIKNLRMSGRVPKPGLSKSHLEARERERERERTLTEICTASSL